MIGTLGCRWTREVTEFLVWAPKARGVELHILSPTERRLAPERLERGYWRTAVPALPEGATYRYRLDGAPERPDPASRFQPEGVFGPSQVCSPDFEWTDASWKGIPLAEHIIYELHTGSFTAGGTFQAAGERLDYLSDLGITAVELMPVGQFPGKRNWGYDVVFPFAVHHTYGRPRDLMAFVDACHGRRMAVILDVVYNHLGPEGNYAGDFGPYFSSEHRTPWGAGINFDGPGSDEVRRFFIENAIGWIRDFHIDGLRLDATHAILDMSPQPFLRELFLAVQAEARAVGRQVCLIAENNLNEPRLVRPTAEGGMGLDGVWNDDFHHALHVALTGERDGYYADFNGAGDLGRAFARGFVYAGEYSGFFQRRRGASAGEVSTSAFVVCGQNHDQVGNRPSGDRIGGLIPPEKQKLLAASVLFSPFTPLLFMGQEYNEQAPFPYFVDLADEGLVRAVREGRKAELSMSGQNVPDPQDAATFASARLTGPRTPGDEVLLAFHRELIRLRRTMRMDASGPSRVSAHVAGNALSVTWASAASRYLLLANYGEAAARLPFPSGPGAAWAALFDTEDRRWLGSGRTLSLACGGDEVELQPGQAAGFGGAA